MRSLWGRADWEAMEADLSSKNWDELDNLEADAAWGALKEVLNKIVEDHVPKKEEIMTDLDGSTRKK